MGRFTADPPVLSEEGNKMKGISQSCIDEVEKVYETLDSMVHNDYLSPEARVLLEKIESKKQDLINMAKVMEEHGDFAVSAAHTVTQNQENISSKINVIQ